MPRKTPETEEQRTARNQRISGQIDQFLAEQRQLAASRRAS